MLARAWRLFAWIIVVPTYAVLKGIASMAARTTIEIQADDLRAERQSHQMTKGLLDVEKAQNSLLAAKLGQYVAHVKAETDAQTARSILATEQTSRE